MKNSLVAPLFTALTILLSAGPVRAAELHVGATERFSTIRAALLEAQPGDTVIVAAGQYHEDLVIDKAVRLVGRDQPHLIGSRNGNVVRIEADGAELEGFRISGSGKRMMYSEAGIRVLGSRVRISGNTLQDNLFGIYLDSCEETIVEFNTIRGRLDDEIGKRGAGIHFFDANHNVVRRNRIHHVRDGVYFDHADFNSVEDNEFSDLRYGVHYMYCKDNRFLRNVFRDSVAGVAVMYTERVTFQDNQIVNNRQGYNAFGLLLKECLDSVAERNVIVNNVNGIFLDNSHRNRFRNNLIAYNDVGVVLYASSLNNQFAGNDFLGNLAVLRTVGRADAVWTVDGRGNFYSDYTGYDLNSDGLGDSSHRLQDAFEYLEGSRPILRLFLNSASADALAAAEKSFPLVPSSDEEDHAPSMRPASGVRMTYRYAGPHPSDSTSWWVLGPLSALLISGYLSWRWRQ